MNYMEYYFNGRGENEWIKKYLVSKKKKEELLKKFRHATIEDYANWLKGFIKSGGRPRYYRDYPFIQMQDEFFVAQHDFWMVPLYGALSVEIIIPKGIRYLGGELGHSKLYFFEDFSCSDNCVSVYSDIRFKKPFFNALLKDSCFEPRREERFGKFFSEEVIYFNKFFRKIEERCDLKSLSELSDELWFKTCCIFYSKNFDLFKDKVDEFGNYFSSLNKNIKEAIIRMILEEELKNERIISWLDKHERSLMCKVTFESY